MLRLRAMTPADAAFVRRCIKRYYFEQFDAVEIPSDIQQREFGYMTESGMVRHMQIRSGADLRVMLLSNTPLDVYVSNARYLLPSMPMGEKEWQEAHLIFDIDAKDIGLECRPSHTASVCGACGHADAGPRDACSKCGGGNIAKQSTACMKCMGAAGDHAARLAKILSEDFGVERIKTYFSGNEGYHMHVHDEGLSGLDRGGRGELADYMALRGIMPETIAGRNAKTEMPKRTEYGWRGRFAGKMSTADRGSIVREAASGVYTTRGRVLEKMVSRLGVRVDPGVTMDVHRIFRMAGTINSKSGMAKTECATPKKFNPYESAVVVHGEPAVVRASCPVRFRMRGGNFGPYDNERVEVPAYAAAYMVCKGLAHAVP